MKVNIKVKSFYTESLNSVIWNIQLFNKSEGDLSGVNFLIINGFFSIPTKNSIYTVLKSPHVNKKSREQFVYKRRTQSLNCFINNFILFNEDQKLSFYALNFLGKNNRGDVSICVKYIL